MTLDFSLLGHRGESIVRLATAIAAAEKLHVFLVGGPVRDLLLRRTTSDVDLMSTAEEIETFAARFAVETGGKLERYPKFLTLKVTTADAVVDLATMRHETYEAPGSLPSVEPGTLADDLRRRDFTINAMALDLLTTELIDPHGGQSDLASGLLRFLHERSFLDDPTRILRGARFVARFGFTFESETETAAREAIDNGAFESVSRERVWREMLFLLREPSPAQALLLLDRWGLIRTFLLVEAPLHVAALAKIASADFLTERQRELALIRHILRGSADPERALSGSGMSRREAALVASHSTVRIPSKDPELLRLLARSGPVAAVTETRTEEEFERIRRLSTRLAAARAQLPKDLEVAPGPHIGRALMDTLVAIATGEIEPSAARDFAQQRAIGYLREDPATPNG